MLFSPWAFPKVLNFTAWSFCIIICHRSGEAMLCPRPSRMRSDSAHLISLLIACASTAGGPVGGAVAEQHSNFYDVLKQQPGVLIIWFPFLFSFECCNGAHWSMWSRLSQLVEDASGTFAPTLTIYCKGGTESFSCTPSWGLWIQFTKCCLDISLLCPSNRS